MPSQRTIRCGFELIVAAARGRTSPGSLAINLARTLLELQGAGLLEIQGKDGCWRAVTVLDRANQRDFFTPNRGGDTWDAAPAFA